MCGIVGVISILNESKTNKFDSEICQAMDNMLWADQLRGVDGTGLMALNSSLELEVVKVAGDVNKLLEKKEAKRILNFTDTNYFTVGHNRSATKGVKDTAVNAHPFLEKDIALVHNGTLHWVNQKYRDKELKHDVDSKAAAKAISELGVKNAINEMSGAYAFVWIDKNKGTLSVLRNFERPLGYIRTGNYILFASEPSLAVWCAARNGIKFDTGAKIEPFEPNQLYTWEAGSLEFKKEACERKTYTSIYGAYGDDSDIYGPRPGRVGSTSFCEGTKSWHARKEEKSGSKRKERVRLLSAHSMEAPYAVGDKVTFKVIAGVQHKNLTRISQGEIINPAVTAVNKHRITGNVPLPITEITGEDQKLDGYIAAIYKSETGYFIFDLRDIVKHVATPAPSISYATDPNTCKSSPSPAVTPDVPKESSKVLDIKSGEKMVDCDCCGALTPESKLKLKKRTITDTSLGTRVKLNFNVCPTCSTNLDSDMGLMAALTEKRLNDLQGGATQ